MVLLSPGAAAEDETPRLRLGGLLDFRFARTDTTASWLDGGLGKARYGGDAGGGQTPFVLAQASVVLRARVAEALLIHAQVNVDTGSVVPSGLAGVDLVEASASFRPRLSEALGLRLKAGHFFPSLSLENDGPAWSPTRTVTASAVNSWVGEEVRVTGAEAALELFLPAADLSIGGAVFGWNDPCGSLLAWRGWAVGDRQSGLSDRLPLSALPAFQQDGAFPLQKPWVAPFREVDGRAGWYANASFSLPERLELRGLLYDNRGDALALESGQYAWKTRFWAGGARVQLPGRAEVVAQLLDGWSEMGPGAPVDLYYRSWFVLASLPLGRHRLSARYERFETWDEDVTRDDPNGEDGDAWTLAYLVEVDRRTLVSLELLSVDSDRPARALVGLPEHAQETLVQLSVKGRF